jgi:hypothetical protein
MLGLSTAASETGGAAGLVLSTPLQYVETGGTAFRRGHRISGRRPRCPKRRAVLPGLVSQTRPAVWQQSNCA